MLTPLELIVLEFDEAVDAILREKPLLQHSDAVRIANSVFYGTDVINLAEDEEAAFEADPDGFLKERQRQKYLAEQSL